MRKNLYMPGKQLIVKYSRPPDKCVIESYFSYFSSKSNVVDTQKNRLNEHTNFMLKQICIKIFTI